MNWNRVPNCEARTVQFHHLTPWAKIAVQRGDLGGISNAFREQHKLQRAGAPRFSVERHMSGEWDPTPIGTPQRLNIIEDQHAGRYNDLLGLHFEPTHLTTENRNLVFLRVREASDEKRTARLRTTLKALGHRDKVVKVDVIPI